MKNISDIRVVSVDLFRTLAQVDDGYEYVWRTFLGDRYTPEDGQRHWNRTTEILLEQLDLAAANSGPFKTTRDIFSESYARYFNEIKLALSPDVAAETLFFVHRLEHFYPDARPFLEAVSRQYRVCLSTDCDVRMLQGIEKLYSFENIFVSEELRAYKANPLFFSRVLDYYQLQPWHVLHIGDSHADILTPARLGLQTCWLNRSGKDWKHAVRPDYEVKSLLEVLDILHVR